MLSKLPKVVGASISVIAIIHVVDAAFKLWDDGPGFENHLREVVRHDNQNLSKMMDGISRLYQETISGRTFIYHGTTMREVAFDRLRPTLEESLRGVYCSQMASFAQKG